MPHDRKELVESSFKGEELLNIGVRGREGDDEEEGLCSVPGLAPTPLQETAQLTIPNDLPRVVQSLYKPSYSSRRSENVALYHSGSVGEQDAEELEGEEAEVEVGRGKEGEESVQAGRRGEEDVRVSKAREIGRAHV